MRPGKLELRAWWLALALGLGGCGKFREVSLCRGVARDVNRAMDEVELLAKAKPPSALAIAKRYGDLASSLSPRAVGEQPLAVALRDYITVLRSTEAVLKSYDAAQKSQPSRGGDQRRELERLIKRDRSAATRVDAECHH